MKRSMKLVSIAIVLLVLAGMAAGCAKETLEIHNPWDLEAAVFENGFQEQPIDSVFLNDGDLVDISLEMVPLTASPPTSIAMPSHPGTAQKKNDKADIDYSNSKDGYVMIAYLSKTTKALRVQIKGPDQVAYTYTLKNDGSYEVFPLSAGNGDYSIGVFEQVEGTKYSTSNSATIKVTLTDQNAPFLRPNQYVNFKSDSETVKKAAELMKDTKDLNEKIAAVYNFVVKNFTYDTELAKNVQSGYLPNVDAVLAKKKGICFDYAAVMTAMLRSQGVPTKLVVGYTGQQYHAWINVFSTETGWMNSAIYFDGKSWKLMDPTFASSAKESSDVMKYIGDGKNYQAKYLY
ncbi:MAG: transglutaminase-like domain-containing protein [Oscillospiraceae bacterium]|nr:transglutaminase-like domain-containing protein [Oscillospiraceae bacterium]